MLVQRALFELRLHLLDTLAVCFPFPIGGVEYLCHLLQRRHTNGVEHPDFILKVKLNQRAAVAIELPDDDDDDDDDDDGVHIW